MSSRKKSKPKADAPAPAVPIGKAPVAMVEARHLGHMITRAGRGFSLAELEGAEVPPSQARRLGVKTDGLRRTTLEANVKALEKWYAPVAKAVQQSKPAPAPEPEPAEPKAEKPSKAPKKKAAPKKKKPKE